MSYSKTIAFANVLYALEAPQRAEPDAFDAALLAAIRAMEPFELP